MADKKIEISDIHSLIAASKGIFHLKYNVFYKDLDSLIQFAGNKFLNKILDDSKRKAYAYFNEEEKWPYSLRDKPFDWLVQSIKTHLESIEEWGFEFSDSEKEEIVSLLLEPMKYDDDLVKELLDYANEFHKADKIP